MHALKPLVQFHQRRLLYRCYSYSASPQEFLSINPFESIANNKSLETHYLNKLQGFVDSGIQDNLKQVLETRAKIAQSKKLYFDLDDCETTLMKEAKMKALSLSIDMENSRFESDKEQDFQIMIIFPFNSSSSFSLEALAPLTAHELFEKTFYWSLRGHRFSMEESENVMHRFKFVFSMEAVYRCFLIMKENHRGQRMSQTFYDNSLMPLMNVIQAKDLINCLTAESDFFLSKCMNLNTSAMYGMVQLMKIDGHGLSHTLLMRLFSRLAFIQFDQEIITMLEYLKRIEIPLHPEYYEALLKAILRRKKYPELRKTFAQVVALGMASPGCYDQVIRGLVEVGELNSCIRVTREYLAAFPNEPAYMCLGFVYEKILLFGRIDLYQELNEIVFKYGVKVDDKTWDYVAAALCCIKNYEFLNDLISRMIVDGSSQVTVVYARIVGSCLVEGKMNEALRYFNLMQMILKMKRKKEGKGEGEISEPFNMYRIYEACANTILRFERSGIDITDQVKPLLPTQVPEPPDIEIFTPEYLQFLPPLVRSLMLLVLDGRKDRLAIVFNLICVHYCRLVGLSKDPEERKSILAIIDVMFTKAASHEYVRDHVFNIVIDTAFLEDNHRLVLKIYSLMQRRSIIISNSRLKYLLSGHGQDSMHYLAQVQKMQEQTFTA